MRSTRGFTLFELLVSMFLVSIILMTLNRTLTSALVAQEEINREFAAVEIGPELLDRIERDLMALHLSNIKENDIFLGRRDTLNGEPADSIDFLARVKSGSTREKPGGIEKDRARADVNEIGYRLRNNPDNIDFLELWRREDFYVDELPFEGGIYERLYDRVISFQILYLDKLGEDPEEFEEWSVKEKGALPAATKIRLVIEPNPRVESLVELPENARRQQLTYTRTILFPRDTEMALRVRPEVPDMELAMSEEAEAGGTGEEGEGSGGGGDDGVVGGGGGDSSRLGMGGPGDGGGDNMGGGGGLDGPQAGGGLANGRRGGGGDRGGGRGGDGDFRDWQDLPDGEQEKLADFLKQWLGGGR